MTNSPQDLGFSAEYDSYRPFQAQTIERIVNSDKPLIVVSAPTGSGKSIIALGVARIAARQGLQTRVLTNNKFLQNQYASYHFDYDTPLQAIGKSNFPCILPGVEPGTTAAEAPCNHGFDCELKKGAPDEVECPYFKQRDQANAARISILNYPFYFYETRYGLFPTDLLICDEGHQIDSQILSVASTDLGEVHLSELHRLGIDIPQGTKLLLSENPKILAKARAALEQVTSHLGKYAEDDTPPPPLYIDLHRRLSSLVSLEGSLAVVQDYKYSPILSEQFARAYLPVKKVVLMSATIFGPEYWQQRLGFEDVEYIEVPSNFPVHKRPIYIQPVTRVNMNWWDRPEDQKKLIDAIDNIIKRNIPKKGLIHSVSYRLTDWILENSLFAGSGYLFKGDSDYAIEKWKQSPVGVLVSPRASEGLDLPGDLCSFIIITKIPYLSIGDEVVKLQMQEIPGFYEYKAIATLIQSAGRGSRHKDDYCATFILDSNYYHLHAKMKSQLPRWWVEALVWQKRSVVNV